MRIFASCFKQAEALVEKEITSDLDDKIVSLFESKVLPLIEKKIEEYLATKTTLNVTSIIPEIVSEIKTDVNLESIN